MSFSELRGNFEVYICVLFEKLLDMIEEAMVGADLMLNKSMALEMRVDKFPKMMGPEMRLLETGVEDFNGIVELFLHL